MLTFFKEAIGDQFQFVKSVTIAILVVVFVAGMYMYISSLNGEIDALNSKILRLQRDKAYLSLEKERFQASNEKQNRKINMLKINEDVLRKKLNRWKNLKPAVKYKTITKVREVHSNECKDIKDTLNAVRSIDFSSL